MSETRIIDPILAKCHADFIAPYLERDRIRALKKYKTADVIDFAAKTGTTPSPDQIRAQFAAAPAPIKQIIKDAHTAGLIGGLRDILIFASREEAAAAWNALPGYVEIAPKMPPIK